MVVVFMAVFVFMRVYLGVGMFIFMAAFYAYVKIHPGDSFARDMLNR